jgi:hypothetical protein
MDDSLLQIARFARQKLEQGHMDPELRTLLIELYSAYNPEVENVPLFVDTALAQFPKLSCGIASLYLRELLGTGYVVQALYGRENHTVYISIDNLIVDITADQYGGPEIYVGEMVEPWLLKSSP